MTVLDDILAAKRDEVTLLHQPATRRAIERAALAAPTPRDFASALRRADGALAVIAELKRRSPSKGDLAPDLDPAVTAKAYEAGGAAALSVLTDRPFFGGSIDDLRAAREATQLPALRKDFTIAEIQLYEARAVGADAVLLIVAAFRDDAYLRDLHDLARDLGLAVLVETHDDAEVERALDLGASIIGVNNRSLQTFAEDVEVAVALADRLPPEVIAVAESAIRTPEDAQRCASVGFDAVLVGEALVRAADPTSLVRTFASNQVTTRGAAT
ncbi:MAG: indole-3-glycerol phosphate synthase [Actinomycetia bacterium]|nr:indole-3-glycerol phosphate synthase [Actinomycetes bacterium]